MRKFYTKAEEISLEEENKRLRQENEKLKTQIVVRDLAMDILKLDLKKALKNVNTERPQRSVISDLKKENTNLKIRIETRDKTIAFLKSDLQSAMIKNSSSKQVELLKENKKLNDIIIEMKRYGVNSPLSRLCKLREQELDDIKFSLGRYKRHLIELHEELEHLKALKIEYDVEGKLLNLDSYTSIEQLIVARNVAFISGDKVQLKKFDDELKKRKSEIPNVVRNPEYRDRLKVVIDLPYENVYVPEFNEEDDE